MKQAEHAIDIAEQTSVITTELTVQSAECEDGMPPESTIARMSHTPCLTFFVKICVYNSSAHQEMPHDVRVAHTAPQHHGNVWQTSACHAGCDYLAAHNHLL